MSKLHNFHIPVMGLAYTIDSPIRVAQFGIDSVISIVDDELAEKMRAFYSRKFEFDYSEISQNSFDCRAKRITAYLNLVQNIVTRKFDDFCKEAGSNHKTLSQFVYMLPKSAIRQKFRQLLSDENTCKETFRQLILENLKPGAIDVNIMTKVDKTNYAKNTPLPIEFNDAHAALRGFANSNLQSSVVLSAGMNPSLYNYITEFPDFFPDGSGQIRKKIILKVSDFRSAMIQGSFLAKKGIWISEYRIESGLNCGGHAFATEGLLLGPVLEEFRQRKSELIAIGFDLLCRAFQQKEWPIPPQPFELKITAQGGIGTSEEHRFLIDYYQMDSVGWGSPFLLVPEATSTDQQTRKLLAEATENDFYTSNISPLGVPFNTVKGTTNEGLKQSRISHNKAGSSCPKKLLALNTAVDPKGICTASRKYQSVMIRELESKKSDLTTIQFQEMKQKITDKACLCVGLANASYLENNIEIKGEAQGIVICPGPNMAYFNREVTLSEMLRHIYGYESILGKTSRPNVFVKELGLYVGYLKKEIASADFPTAQQIKKWKNFKGNLENGIAYYEEILSPTAFFHNIKKDIFQAFREYRNALMIIEIPG
ncbi:hypothetical protein FNO01nite_29170 [Flavobacterium noncentrifugens]|uniref:Uncharacterized protein n=1 Tax=Flavobacterium noncentrifugens TaxID=1128970 RepID=A0A1G8Y128_9FLAO|nr:hypothetical protein [Flavobacterium noncentrifugens]GEP52245.1 hypothetical protein FNO01nite_29170 [Flavobacterium noncentrifugens]SDJ95825.1 hypothetical protein SAMN04487935_2124 [Flavobacterium noncentrifugens]